MAFSSDDIQIILQYFMEQLPEDKLAELDARIDGTATEHPAMDAALAKKPNAQAKALADEARALIAALPITQVQAGSAELRGAFTGAKEKGARQAEIESQWASFARDNYAKAKAKAEEALKAAK